MSLLERCTHPRRTPPIHGKHRFNGALHAADGNPLASESPWVRTDGSDDLPRDMYRNHRRSNAPTIVVGRTAAAMGKTRGLEDLNRDEIVKVLVIVIATSNFGACD
ncbi:MAG: hypothetical protein P8J45_11015 [Phycisphaerales bacterium]|nr:hypothetical protein [Phycisphaerales bacterium]